MAIIAHSNKAYSNTPARRPLAVSDFSISLSGTAKVGDTSVLYVSFKSKVTGTARITYMYTENFAPLNKTAGETTREDTVIVYKDSTVTRSYYFKAYDEGYSMLEVGIISDSADPTKYKTQASRSIYVEHLDGYSNSYGGNSGYTQSVIAYEGTIPQKNKYDKHPKAQAPTTYNISISGKVMYKIDDNDPNALKSFGVYGARVVLGFRKSSDTTQIYVPDVFSRDSRGLLNGPRVWLNGNFSVSKNFELGFNLKDLGYDQLIVYVVKENNSIALTSEQQPKIEVTGSTSGITFYTFPLSGALILPTPDTLINGVMRLTASNYNIFVDKVEGMALRNMELTWDYTKSIYNYLDQIRCKIDKDFEENEGFAGFFTVSPLLIKLDDQYTELLTASHEYGHYVHYAINNFLGNFDVTEGWAMFYSWAVRQYVAKKYDEPIDKFYDNCEEEPYNYAGGIRYPNMNYAGDLEATGLACFIWSVYDGYQDGDYGTTTYNKNDNDDVDGLRELVFSTMGNIKADNGITSYRNNLQLLISDNLLNESVADMYKFMLTDTAHKMRPAQLEELRGLWCRETGTIQLSWKQQHYTPKPALYHNWETGYRVDRWDKSSQTWVNAYYAGHSLPPDTRFASPPVPFLTGGDTCITFRVTAFNTSGDSYKPQEVPVCLRNCSSLFDDGNNNGWISDNLNSGNLNSVNNLSNSNKSNNKGTRNKETTNNQTNNKK